MRGLGKGIEPVSEPVLCFGFKLHEVGFKQDVVVVRASWAC